MGVGWSVFYRNGSRLIFNIGEGGSCYSMETLQKNDSEAVIL